MFEGPCVPDCELNPNHLVLYNDEFDSYYCDDCGEWVEPRCSDLECQFCSVRPPFPPVGINPTE